MKSTWNKKYWLIADLDVCNLNFLMALLVLLGTRSLYHNCEALVWHCIKCRVCEANFSLLLAITPNWKLTTAITGRIFFPFKFCLQEPLDICPRHPWIYLFCKMERVIKFLLFQMSSASHHKKANDYHNIKKFNLIFWIAMAVG